MLATHKPNATFSCGKNTVSSPKMRREQQKVAQIATFRVQGASRAWG